MATLTEITPPFDPVLDATPQEIILYAALQKDEELTRHTAVGVLQSEERLLPWVKDNSLTAHYLRTAASVR